MFRSVVSRALVRSSAPHSIRSASSRRFLTTVPPVQKPRGWKNTALRWGLAFSAVYWYNTSSVFAEEPAYAATLTTEDETEQLPTIDEIAAARKAAQMHSPQASSSTIRSEYMPAAEIGPEMVGPGSPEALEEEADQQGAFNPETGEINWNCPCLGGMAHGPCGEEFKAAFSCFVYSTEEPKGMDCIDKFKGMQECFRKYPEVYGDELADESDDINEESSATVSQAHSPRSDPPLLAKRSVETADIKPQSQSDSGPKIHGKQKLANDAASQVTETQEPPAQSEEPVSKSVAR